MSADGIIRARVVMNELIAGYRLKQEYGEFFVLGIAVGTAATGATYWALAGRMEQDKPERAEA